MRRRWQHCSPASKGEQRPAARAWGLRAGVVAACLLFSSPSPAQGELSAESLFREGRRLLAEGRLAEACDRFAESQRLEPSSGALLNLARCHADAGMTATAWHTYIEAARLARSQDRPQQAAEAELRAAELQSRLVRLRIALDPRAQGVQVTRNGEPLAASELDVPLLVDPGSYVVRASAPGHSDWTTTVVVAQPGQVRTVVVPPLAPVPRSPQAPVPAPRPIEHRDLRTVPAPSEAPGVSARTWVTAGVGAAALVSSAVLAGIAKTKWDDAHERGACDPSHACNGRGLAETDEARRLGNFATGFALAGLAVGACAVLFYASDVSRKGPVQARLAVGPGGAVVGVQGGF